MKADPEQTEPAVFGNVHPEDFKPWMREVQEREIAARVGKSYADVALEEETKQMAEDLPSDELHKYVGSLAPYDFKFYEEQQPNGKWHLVSKAWKQQGVDLDALQRAAKKCGQVRFTRVTDSYARMDIRHLDATNLTHRSVNGRLRNFYNMETGKSIVIGTPYDGFKLEIHQCGLLGDEIHVCDSGNSEISYRNSKDECFGFDSEQTYHIWIEDGEILMSLPDEPYDDLHSEEEREVF